MNKYDVSRFLRAQEGTHTAAVRELRNGMKMSHWSWWEIPQIVGLGETGDRGVGVDVYVAAICDQRSRGI